MTPTQGAPPDDPAAHYDLVTRAWRYLLGNDLHYGLFESADQPLETATANLTRLMADRAKIADGHRVLDVGCGIGTPAIFLLKSFRCRVTGLSTSEEGLSIARRRAAAEGLGDRAAFVLADGMNNGLPAESFERVWIMESSHLMPRKAALLAESSRVLRPGGLMQTLEDKSMAGLVDVIVVLEVNLPCWAGGGGAEIDKR